MNLIASLSAALLATAVALTNASLPQEAPQVAPTVRTVETVDVPAPIAAEPEAATEAVLPVPSVVEPKPVVLIDEPLVEIAPVEAPAPAETVEDVVTFVPIAEAGPECFATTSEYHEVWWATGIAPVAPCFVIYEPNNQEQPVDE